ncbi:MAG: S41 family peptidase [Gemmiger sp.]|nr:S41 family peptidase [Gemmiger sp.]
MSKKISISLAATVAIIAMAVTFSVTMVISTNMFNNTVSSVKSKEQMYNKLAEVDRYVRANEYFAISEDTLNDTIASGYMLGISDKYARYYSAKAYAERQSVASGKLMGIGVSVARDPSSGYACITRVYDNSPAAELGLQKGGYITAIGEVGTRTMQDANAVTSALLGEEGTVVSIKYLTPDRQEQSYDVTHSGYPVPTVFSQLTGNNCGYLRIESFASGTGTEFRTAMDNLAAQGATSYVFDVRDNSGENLNAALIAADYCVPSGLIAQSETDGDPEDLRVSDDHEVTAPMVCLVNGSTAQGAELFANALRKMANATVVGTNTAGKGVLLSDPQSLSDGSAIVITIGMLLDNEGLGWNGAGLAPDVDATLSTDEQNAYYSFTIDNDPQINKAVGSAAAMAG